MASRLWRSEASPKNRKRSLSSARRCSTGSILAKMSGEQQGQCQASHCNKHGDALQGDMLFFHGIRRWSRKPCHMLQSGNPCHVLRPHGCSNLSQPLSKSKMHTKQAMEHAHHSMASLACQRCCSIPADKVWKSAHRRDVWACKRHDPTHFSCLVLGDHVQAMLT